jgi:P-type conjugative transfer protein TrbJ
MHFPRSNRVVYRWIPVVVCGLLCGASPAHAQFGLGGVVFDPRNLAQAVTLYRRVLDQLALQRQQLQSQVLAMRKLATPPWRDITTTMAQIDAITRDGNAITYSLRNVDAVFRTTFAGTASIGQVATVEQRQVARTLATLRGTLNAAQRSAAALPDGLTRIREMKRQVTAVQGHEQALELNGTIGIYTAEQLTLLSQQLAALTNANAVAAAHAVNVRAQTDANVRAFLTHLGAIPPSRPGFTYRRTP